MPIKQVVLDDTFIPTVLQIRAATRLSTFTTELLGLFRQRGEALGGRVAATSRGAASELADFLMLQAINRGEPLLAHFAEGGVVHPEAFFQFCVAAAGELATFTTTSKRTPRFPVYRHDHLKETFEPVIASLRESMSKVMTQNAIPIPLEPRKFGVSVAIVADRSLFSSAVFILAARADGPAEYVRQRFPAQVKIAPAEKIGDLVVRACRASRWCRFRSPRGRSLFTPAMRISSSIRPTSCGNSSRGRAAWRSTCPGEFPGLTMEFWAIRG